MELIFKMLGKVENFLFIVCITFLILNILKYFILRIYYSKEETKKYRLSNLIENVFSRLFVIVVTYKLFFMFFMNALSLLEHKCVIANVLTFMAAVIIPTLLLIIVNDKARCDKTYVGYVMYPWFVFKTLIINPITCFFQFRNKVEWVLKYKGGVLDKKCNKNMFLYILFLDSYDCLLDENYNIFKNINDHVISVRNYEVILSGYAKDIKVK